MLTPKVTCRMTGSAHRLAEAAAQQAQARAAKRQAMQDEALALWHRQLNHSNAAYGPRREY